MIVLEKNHDLYGRFSAWHPFACAQTYQPKAPLLHMIKIEMLWSRWNAQLHLQP
jgi:hypothetical protein